MISEDDVYLFNEGRHFRLWETLGAHVVEGGVRFAVWAPNAEAVSVVGDFNGWDPRAHPMEAVRSSGIWETTIPGVGKGAVYKFHIVGRGGGYRVDKADPYGVMHESPPRTASVVWDREYRWGDAHWMKTRSARNALAAPISIYEAHLGSWMRVPEEGARSLTYREIAPRLAEHAKSCGFTHVELLPVMEHPFLGSWGYQVTGYFAPTARYGTPQDFAFLVDTLHQAGVGVILDWVPAHFPTDEHGLGYFDGTHLYEHADPRRGFHPDWKTYVFNYSRHEVRSFLISSALFWIDVFHADGLRVDGVASMLYLDYSRKHGEWIPNEFGGRENVDAIRLLREMNEAVYGLHPDVQTYAEESTAWPMVTRPTSIGGLGFGLKWDMGWMHDTLKYLQRETVHRKHHHHELTFRTVYAFHENFVMPLSHDEVVHGKASLIGKMPGDDWQKFANLRLLYAYMWGQPGKKLLFMGGEMAQWREWDHDGSLEWHLLQFERHAGIRSVLHDLNALMIAEPALHALDTQPAGFEWLVADDAEQSVYAWLRLPPENTGPPVLVVCNFTPVPRPNYRVGIPTGGRWKELLNTDAQVYGGSGMGNLGGVDASPLGLHGKPYALTLNVPPLGALFLRPE
jgi:1,4-alpha-glucan branching enzyme